MQSKSQGTRWDLRIVGPKNLGTGWVLRIAEGIFRVSGISGFWI